MATFVPNDPSWYVVNALNMQRSMAEAQAAAAQTLGLTPQKYEPRARGFVRNYDYSDNIRDQSNQIDDFESLVAGVARPGRKFTVAGTYQDAFGNIQGTGTQQIVDPGYADNLALWNTLRSLPGVYDAARESEQAQADRSDQTLLQGARTLQRQQSERAAREAAGLSSLLKRRQSADRSGDPFRVDMDMLDIGAALNQR